MSGAVMLSNSIVFREHTLRQFQQWHGIDTFFWNQRKDHGNLELLNCSTDLNLKILMMDVCRWTAFLAAFSINLRRHLSRRVVLQHARQIGRLPESASDDGSSDVSDLDDDEVMTHEQNGGAHLDSSDKGSVLPFDAQKRVAKVLLTLASKAQFSKVWISNRFWDV